MIELRVLDEPTGKGRPRFSRKSGRAYTPGKTTKAEGLVRLTWGDAGEPELPGETELVARVECFLRRPPTHFLKDGSLSAAGRRAGRRPRKKPDVDNAAKLILDALEGYAYPSDAAIVELTVAKFWTSGDDPETTTVYLWTLDEWEAS